MEPHFMCKFFSRPCQVGHVNLRTDVEYTLAQTDLILKQKESSILKLPNEILLQILSSTHQPITPHQTSSRSTELAFCLTCRRFCHIGQAVLFEHLRYEERAWQKMYSSLRSNSSLPFLCKRFSFYRSYKRPVAKDIAEIRNVFSMLCNLGSIHMHCNEVTWPALLEQLPNMVHLKELALTIYDSASWPGPPPTLNDSRGGLLSQIVNSRGLLNLQTLKMVDGIFGTPIRVNGFTVHEFQARKSRLKTLIIQSPRFHPDDLEEFLRWPTALEKLTMTDFEPFYSGYNHSPYIEYDTQAIMRILSVQSKSLRNITLSQQRTSSPPLDFRRFSSLKTLTIPWIGIPRSVEDADLLFNVHKLKIDFDGEDQQCSVWWPFDGQSAMYIEQLARASHSSNGSLRQIHISWDQGEDYGSSNHPYPMIDTYNLPESDHAAIAMLEAHWEPWLEMQRLRDILKPLDITLTFQMPNVSYDDATKLFTQMVKDLKDQPRPSYDTDETSNTGTVNEQQEMGIQQADELEVGQRLITNFFTSAASVSR